MKSILILPVLLFIAITSVVAKNADTIRVTPQNIQIKNLETGNYSYILYTKKNKESPAQNITLVKINVEALTYHNRPAFSVKQEWDRDTIWHAAYSIFDAKDFSTILHDTWWKRLGYSTKFDFEAKTADFTKNGLKGEIPDSVKSSAIKDFKQSFEKYNLNWHADLIVYQLLPYKENRTFIINYYDPGFGKAEEVPYSVTGSDVLISNSGEKIDCWVLAHTDTNGTERFWIAKKNNEVLKEEDEGARGYRYKIKLGISGDK